MTGTPLTLEIISMLSHVKISNYYYRITNQKTSASEIRCGAIETIFIRLPEVTTNKLKKSSKEKSRGQKLL